MSKQNPNVAKLDEPQEVFAMPFEPSDEPTELLQPREEPFNFSASTIAPHGTTILRWYLAIDFRGGNQFNAALAKAAVKCITIISGITDDACPQFLQKTYLVQEASLSRRLSDVKCFLSSRVFPLRMGL